MRNFRIFQYILVWSNPVHLVPDGHGTPSLHTVGKMGEKKKWKQMDTQTFHFLWGRFCFSLVPVLLIKFYKSSECSISIRKHSSLLIPTDHFFLYVAADLHCSVLTSVLVCFDFFFCLDRSLHGKPCNERSRPKKVKVDKC